VLYPYKGVVLGRSPDPVVISVDDGEFCEVGGVVVVYAQYDQGAIVGRDCSGAAVVVGGGHDDGAYGLGGLVGRYARENFA
jgi:hypothetical protein